MRRHAKKRSRAFIGQHGVSMQDGRDGRILSIEFISLWFPELQQLVLESKKVGNYKDLCSIKFLREIAFLLKHLY
jgi:hypothetical protein